jgi:(1->4)-alpha-D-glucan 1-alpha-D-glucosylmutase
MIASALDRLISDTLRWVSERRRVPVATYRLQMHAGFTFRDAKAIVPYLSELGVTHAYLSPLLAARKGSQHGYDVRDHSKLNPELGTEEEFTELREELKRHGMGMILDAVPNHMCVGCENAWWDDVLEHGPASPFANYFDIAWSDHPREALRGKLLAPILDDTYARVLEAGRIRLDFEAGRFSLRLGETRLPIDPRTYDLILGPAAELARDELGVTAPETLELQSIVNSVSHLPGREANDAESVASTRAESAVIQRRLGELAERLPEADRLVRASLGILQGTPEDGQSFSALDHLLEVQPYRLSYWRVASDEINYRRFFDVTDLAALSTERQEVFDAVHEKLFELLMRDGVDGLRIDHPDGLYDPKQYLDRLQLQYRLRAARHLMEQHADQYIDLTWEGAEKDLRERFSQLRDAPLYVVVEKILEPNETVPEDWACEGTTGYEAMNAINELFVDPRHEEAFTSIYTNYAKLDESFEELVYQNKVLILRSSLSSELHMLAHQLDRLAQMERWSRDFTLNGLRHALQEVIACFPTYRSYVDGKVRDTDRHVIQRAIRRARKRGAYLGKAVFDFVAQTLLLKPSPSGHGSDEYRAAQLRFVGKFQQVTSPIMAKGFEDTSLYVYNRLVSLNEVGGDPTHFGRSPHELHRFLQDRSSRHPQALTPLSTHDTKRSEDARARINVLSEIPAAWREAIQRWRDLNRPHRVEMEDDPAGAPAPNDEYLFYQNLLAVWPRSSEATRDGSDLKTRMLAYMYKATHEAKVHTGWINPVPEYDAAVEGFVDKVLDPKSSPEFMANFDRFVGSIAGAARLNTLAQTVLKLTIPGVPDCYQGTEFTDLSLVDPDNRRPVDYGSRQRALSEEQSAPFRPDLDPDRTKLKVTSLLLRYRREHSSLFHRGDYRPIEAEGNRADHVFAFARGRETDTVLVVVPRLTMGFCQGKAEELIACETWKETYLPLPEGFEQLEWRNVLTGETRRFASRAPVSEFWSGLPVAVWKS